MAVEMQTSTGQQNGGGDTDRDNNSGMETEDSLNGNENTQRPPCSAGGNESRNGAGNGNTNGQRNHSLSDTWTPLSEKAVWEAFRRGDEKERTETSEDQKEGSEVVPIEDPEREVTRFLFVEMSEELDKTEDSISLVETENHGENERMEQVVEEEEEEVYLPDDIMPTYEEEAVMFEYKKRKTSKKQGSWGPVQAARKSNRVKDNLPIMEKAELLKMRKNLEIPKTTLRGLAEDKFILGGLDETAQGATGRGDETLQRPHVEKAKITTGIGTRLRCCETAEQLSWSKNIQGMSHGGRATLEQVKENPRLVEEVHVVFFPMS
ncbi:uncharacterized protein LOC119368924 [Triticum dicoccoides]|uniref:uncharacterized protein LOC119368924 n=1 Tax=Triticum dicoccoides TaxID=85692 RepID=UPI001890872E|nr:uncharacterized protein LOC119368924 [Triticum dicoccoides]